MEVINTIKVIMHYVLGFQSFLLSEFYLHEFHQEDQLHRHPHRLGMVSLRTLLSEQVDPLALLAAPEVVLAEMDSHVLNVEIPAYTLKLLFVSIKTVSN